MTFGARVYMLSLAYGPRWLVTVFPVRWRAAWMREIVPGIATLVDGKDRSHDRG